jgi:hypothetical protein
MTKDQTSVRIIGIIGTGSTGADQEGAWDRYRVLDGFSELPGVPVLAGHKSTLRKKRQGTADAVGVVTGDPSQPGDGDGLAVQKHGKETGQGRTFQ